MAKDELSPAWKAYVAKRRKKIDKLRKQIEEREADILDMKKDVLMLTGVQL